MLNPSLSFPFFLFDFISLLPFPPLLIRLTHFDPLPGLCIQYNSIRFFRPFLYWFMFLNFQLCREHGSINFIGKKFDWCPLFLGLRSPGLAATTGLHEKWIYVL